ncbi:hypothetical protein BSK64_24075 [Paenibacillus odorifer]|uniref:hypothetical protein n=1 Tax=Paenibacillus odorifer TaxID=189426 RepID=UPI00096DAB2D|nr:hypothetical protein [Paenibacillus odorifer]OME00108.1 hypothetical protein BSK64_24075 [Paenibacillus odorifer]
MFSHVNTPPWTHYRQSVNYCPLFILASQESLFARKEAIEATFGPQRRYWLIIATVWGVLE